MSAFVVSDSVCSRLPDVNAKVIPLTETLSFAGQLSRAQLKNLSLIGVKSVVNLRETDEEGALRCF